MMKIAFIAAAAVAVLTTAPLTAPAKAQGVDVRTGGDRYDHRYDRGRRGTGTQTIGVPHVRPALALPQGTVLNQTLPLNQSTGTNQTIGVPQVRPALVLPQGTVQMTLPLNQRTGTNQTTSMRPQGVIGKRF